MRQYEALGDANVRLAAVADSIPFVAEMADMARGQHRQWFETIFAHELPTAAAARRRTVAALYAVADQPADTVIANGALLGAFVGAESLTIPSVALCPNVYLRRAPGMPPFGLGWRPPSGPLGRARDQVANGVITRLWRTGLPSLDRARTEFGLDPLSASPARTSRVRWSCSDGLCRHLTHYRYAA